MSLAFGDGFLDSTPKAQSREGKKKKRAINKLNSIIIKTAALQKVSN